MPRRGIMSKEEIEKELKKMDKFTAEQVQNKLHKRILEQNSAFKTEKRGDGSDDEELEDADADFRRQIKKE